MARTQTTPTDTVSPSPQVQRLKERVRKKPALTQQPGPVDIKECRWVPSGKGGRYEYLVGKEWLTRGQVPHADDNLNIFRKKNPEWKQKSGKPEDNPPRAPSLRTVSAAGLSDLTRFLITRCGRMVLQIGVGNGQLLENATAPLVADLELARYFAASVIFADAARWSSPPPSPPICHCPLWQAGVLGG